MLEIDHKLWAMDLELLFFIGVINLPDNMADRSCLWLLLCVVFIVGNLFLLCCLKPIRGEA